MIPPIALAALPFVPGGKEALGSAGDALTGKSGFQASGYTSAEGYDPNAKFYGGSAEASQAEAYDRAAEADRAQQRQGVRIDKGQSNYAAQQADYARQEQGAAMGLMRDRATGAAPSIAQMQADRQMDQARSAQASAAASARGPAGLAMAQQGAAANMAAQQQGISAQAQIAAAQERQAAEQAYFGAASGIRGGDVSQQQLYAQQAQQQAAVDMQQRQLNDQRSSTYDQGAWRVGEGNQAAAMQEQGYVAAGHNNAQGLNQATQQSNSKGVQDLAKGVMGSATGALTGALLSDVRAKQNIVPIEPYKSKTPGASHNYSSKPNRSDETLAQFAALAPAAYQYKPETGKDPQQTHVGPMAQNMAAAPITSTAVVQDPQTGALGIDGDRGLKLALGGVGYLAQKQAEEDERRRQAGGYADVRPVRP